MIGTSDLILDFWERVTVPFTHGTCWRDVAFYRTGSFASNSSESRCRCAHNKSCITAIFTQEWRTDYRVVVKLKLVGDREGLSCERPVNPHQQGKRKKERK